MKLHPFEEELIAEYLDKHPQSRNYFERAKRSLIRGGSHTLRLFPPLPLYDVKCSGSKITDRDGNTYLDFWQGHMANILGHNPPLILDALTRHFKNGAGLQTGFPSSLQVELAEILLSRLKTDKIRFTTSGTLATMYAVMLARAKTGRTMVLKASAGWHGANPYLLKGINYYEGEGFSRLESAGLHKGASDDIIITSYNNGEDLEDKFRKYGERLACFIVEPVLGGGGFIPAQPEYLAKARKLTEEYGALLIFDEIISGFRFTAAGVQSLYGIKPDLTVLAKIIGGGMPLAAVAGRGDIMELCDPDSQAEPKVKFEGGTFSAHPASLLAGITMVTYLIENEDKVYPKLARLGERIRQGAKKIFQEEGIEAETTGDPNKAVKGSSLSMLHFPKKEGGNLDYPDDLWNPELFDVALRVRIMKIGMLLYGVNIADGLGAVSTAHSDEDIDYFFEALRKFAKRLKEGYFRKRG
ncbi:MAG: aminotransferase class III-fold pyridoxal phosphate-dependent enzyme [Acidobacteria bacterium]|nr:aminotransferase class III-fold pyridoxal phosphate-dependent enzyme [Acidobacteriota bacterium]